MSGVVLSDSLFQSYFLLEMLTLSTYLLVGFWYAQPLVVTAARDAFLTKRVGDVLLLMGVVALCSYSGVMGFNDLYAWAAQDTLSPAGGNAVGFGSGCWTQRANAPSSPCTSGWTKPWRARTPLRFCGTRWW